MIVGLPALTGAAKAIWKKLKRRGPGRLFFRSPYGREPVYREWVCLFQDGITREEFEELARRTAKRIKRIHRVEVNGTTIRCEVDSQSGISTWSFEIDFNDFGHLTGAWRIKRRENDDSNIPGSYGRKMQEAIRERLQ